MATHIFCWPVKIVIHLFDWRLLFLIRLDQRCLRYTFFVEFQWMCQHTKRIFALKPFFFFKTTTTSESNFNNSEDSVEQQLQLQKYCANNCPVQHWNLIHLNFHSILKLYIFAARIVFIMRLMLRLLTNTYYFSNSNIKWKLSK